MRVRFEALHDKSRTRLMSFLTPLAAERRALNSSRVCVVRIQTAVLIDWSKTRVPGQTCYAKRPCPCMC
jgi:hypothetical protein